MHEPSPMPPELDTRLLRILDVLLTESSVSRAAQRLGQSQPSVSAALRRLRGLLDDELLVRNGGRLVPSERGAELAPLVRRILADMAALGRPAEGFVPARSTRRIRLAAANCLGAFFLPRIVELVRAEAPGVTLELCRMPAEDGLSELLATGEIDLVIGNWPQPADQLRTAQLFETEIVCMLRGSHPRAGAASIDLETYLALDHLSPTMAAEAALSPIDGRLAQLGHRRRISVSVPEYALVPYVLARTDLLFTTGRPFAELLAAMMPFHVLPAPAELGRMRFYMLWHERTHHSEFCRWLRRLLRRVAGELRHLDPAGTGDDHNAELIAAIRPAPLPAERARTLDAAMTGSAASLPVR